MHESSSSISILSLNLSNEYDRDVASAQAHIDEATWAATWAGGQAMQLEQAIADALRDEPVDHGAT